MATTTPLAIPRTTSLNLIDINMMSSPPLSKNTFAAGKELNNFLLRTDRELRTQREASCDQNVQKQVPMRVPDEITMGCMAESSPSSSSQLSSRRGTIALRPLRNISLQAAMTKQPLCPSCARRSMETPTRHRIQEEDSSPCTCYDINASLPSSFVISQPNNRDLMMTPNRNNINLNTRQPAHFISEKTSSIAQAASTIITAPADRTYQRNDSPPPAPLFEMMDCDDEEESVKESCSRIHLKPKVHQRQSRSSSPQSSPEDIGAATDSCLTLDLPPMVTVPPLLPLTSPVQNAKKGPLVVARSSTHMELKSTPRTPVAS